MEDLSELNKQMFALQNDFQYYKSEPEVNNNNNNNITRKQMQPKMQQQMQSQMQSQIQSQMQQQMQPQLPTQFPKQEEVNFRPIQNYIDTTQIKRPTKSGEQRDDINEKMNMLNTAYFTPDIMNSNSPDVINKYSQQAHQNFQTSRNNSNYINNINNLQSSQTRTPQTELSKPNNHFSEYYNNNYDTLQSHNKSQLQYGNLDMNTPAYELDIQQQTHYQNQYQQQYNQQHNQQHNQQNNNNSNNTHSNNGISMLNVRNMYSMNNSNGNANGSSNMSDMLGNKINDTGYHRIDEKKTDYRQNMNNKIDGMIFDNPYGSQSINPILQQKLNNNNNTMQKDTRMVIQDSNKDYYRQSANDRMAQYSPLSRSSNIPIHMANMSVNDFYSNMNPTNPANPAFQDNSGTNKSLITEEHNKLNSKEMLNNRINNYSPLAKTIQYEANKSQTNAQYQQQQNQQQQNQQQQNQQNQQNATQFQQKPLQKPQQWNPMDVNGKLQNVVYNQMPIFSNSERA
jgi:hypothetical protein